MLPESRHARRQCIFVQQQCPIITCSIRTPSSDCQVQIRSSCLLPKLGFAASISGYHHRFFSFFDFYLGAKSAKHKHSAIWCNKSASSSYLHVIFNITSPARGSLLLLFGYFDGKCQSLRSRSSRGPEFQNFGFVEFHVLLTERCFTS